MTTFNREAYVAAAIESVLASAFHDFELIVVDDRSSDATVEIVRRYARRDSRISLHLNDVNLGDYPNRNRAASFARGRYLKYVDADDLIYPYTLELLVGMMEQFPSAGYGLCSMAQDFHRPFPFSLEPAEAYRYHYFGPGLFHRAPLSCIIRRDVFNEVGGFTGRRMVGDNEMWHILSRRYPVVLMPDGMVWSRVHDAQEMNEVAREPARYDALYWNVTIEQLSHPGCPLSPEERREVVGRQQALATRRALRALTRRRFADARLYVDWIRQTRRSTAAMRVASPRDTVTT